MANLPEFVETLAEEAMTSLLPTKSKGKYDKAYHNFEKWREENSINVINEKVLLAFFKGKLDENKSSSNWTI